MKTFDTTASLAAARLQANQLVEVQGYSAIGDGGHGLYLIVPAQAADEAVDFTLANGTVAVLQFGKSIYAGNAGVARDSAGLVDYTDELTSLIVGRPEPIALPVGTILLNDSITSVTGAINKHTLEGSGVFQTNLQMGVDGKPIFDFNEKDVGVAKNFYLDFSKFRMVGRSTATVPLMRMGTNDFNFYSHLVFDQNGANGIEMVGSFIGATTLNECYFFQIDGWGALVNSRTISDLDFTNCRFEGTSVANVNNANGISLSCSPKHSTVSNKYNNVTARFESCAFERLDGLSIHVEQGGGVNITGANRFSKTSVLLGHRSYGCVVNGNTFVDQGATVIDSGYNNDIGLNNYGIGSGFPVFSTDKGYGSLITNPEFAKANGADGWTFSSSDVRRIQGFENAKPGTNVIRCTNNGTATLDQAVSSDTFYCLKTAFSGSPTRSDLRGGTIRILDKTNGDAVLFTSGDLLNEDLSKGNPSLESYVFKTAGTTADITVELASVNSEHIHFMLMDVSENTSQDNPSLEDTWSSGVPTANWSVEGDMSISEYSSDFHSGSKSARVQCPAITSSTSEIRIGNLGLSSGQSYEISFWAKDLQPELGASLLLTSIGFVDVIFGLGRTVSYAEGIDGWFKVTYQVTSSSQDADILIPARRGPATYRRAMDMIFDDICITPITDTL